MVDAELDTDRIQGVFERLARSRFRQRFTLKPADRAYAMGKGAGVLREHAQQFVVQRLAPANPPRDGKQTPMRGHPVFLAQHATATCCRGCMAKWHGIPKGRALGPRDQAYVLTVIGRWISRQVPALTEQGTQPRPATLWESLPEPDQPPARD